MVPGPCQPCSRYRYHRARSIPQGRRGNARVVIAPGQGRGACRGFARKCLFSRGFRRWKEDGPRRCRSTGWAAILTAVQQSERAADTHGDGPTRVIHVVDRVREREVRTTFFAGEVQHVEGQLRLRTDVRQRVAGRQVELATVLAVDLRERDALLV